MRSSVLHFLRRREVGSNSQRELQTCLVKKTQNNLLSGSSTSKWLKFGEEFEDRALYTARNADLLASIHGSSLSLHDISLNKELWSLPLPDSGNGFKIEPDNRTQLKVSSSGIVICIVEKQGCRWPVHGEYLILIFSQGQYHGAISNISLIKKSIRVIHDRIFAVSEDRRFLYEWEKSGALIRSLLLEDGSNKFHETSYPPNCRNLLVKHDEDFLTVVGNCPGGKALIFILYLKTNEHKIYSVIGIPENYYILKICLANNKIVLGIQDAQVLARRLDSKLFIFDLVTRKIEREYPLPHLKRTFVRLLANKNSIVFLLHESLNEVEVFNFDIEKKSYTKIKSIPYVSANFPRSINTSLLGNSLVLSYPEGRCSTGTDSVRLQVIDLETNQIIRETRYQRFPFFNKFSFVDGKVFNSSHFSNQTFSIEDFSSTPEPKEGPTSSLK